MLLQDLLERTAVRLPEKVALVLGDHRVRYGELEARANKLARALVRRGVERGDRVAIFGDSGIEVAVAVWGALKADAVFMVVNPQTKKDKLSYVLRDSAAKAIVMQSDLAPVVRSAAERAPELATAIAFGGGLPDLGALPVASWRDALAAEEDTAPPRRSIDQDLASIVYTSGSTGEPKGVMLTHLNMVTAATSVSTYLGAVEDDVVLCALPLAFDYGLYQLLMAARVGARVVIEKGFSYPSAVLDTVVRERVTAFPAVPTLFALLVHMREWSHDLSAVRYVTNTAAALPLSHIGRLREIFPRAQIFSMYGLTECKRCTYLPPSELSRRPDSVGVAIPNTELWLEDDSGRRLGPGEVGELVIRGATVMRGYWNKPGETAKMLKPGPLPGEMVLHTGDLCRLDEDGYLYFVARRDDIIKSRGEKVSPREVENVLHGLVGVREVAVVGVPDPILGHAVKAFVVLADGVHMTEGQIVAHCRDNLEPFMVPKQVEFRDALPRTDTGKIKKTGLA